MAGWKQDIRRYGVAKARTIEAAARDLVPPEKSHEEDLAYRKKEQADICLNCKQKECSGSPECFKKHANEKSSGSD